MLWEALAPHSLDEIDWSWADDRLATLRSYRIRPIVGLLHHGSGPRYTSLLDPEFPQKIARFAASVARRYPWIDAYAPVNEPLTTARFSALYGHWYPHKRDGLAFARALLNQCRGIVLAMRAIRGINPTAALVQTEDLGRTHSTRRLRYQADFENERRWLTWDLLTGRLNPREPMWQYLSWLGITPDEMHFFRKYPCPPGILGINYYVTSERYLDERAEKYPSELHGSNGSDFYADDAAVRAREMGIGGTKMVMAEAFRRYELPLALTEVHLGDRPEEQMRWFMEAWRSGETLRGRGVDIRAVTSWALLGSFNWNNLVTRNTNYYEPGAFSIRSGSPERTALADMLQQLARGKTVSNSVLDSPGWWRQRTRLRTPATAAIAA